MMTRGKHYCLHDDQAPGHKSEMVSLLISVSLSVKEYIEEK